MGHAYIERLPRSKDWQEVVALIRGGADAATVAGAVVAAARTVILPLAKDRGVVEATWHLLRLPLAAADDDYPGGLRRAGLDVGDPPGLMDLLAALSDALDREVPVGRRTDLGEMAHTALVETLAGHVGEAVAGLYGEHPEAVREAVATTATVKRFGALAAAYFARVVRKTLDFFVSRALADQTGARRRFQTLAAQAAFTDALREYAEQVAAGVDVYAGGWFNKARHETDGRISRTMAAAFLSHAAGKLDWALSKG
jgi:hypothetical protein